MNAWTDELGAAWRRCLAAMPDGGVLYGLYMIEGHRWSVSAEVPATKRRGQMNGQGETPVDALGNLAGKLEARLRAADARERVSE